MDSENRKFTLLSFFVFSALCAYIFFLILTQFADWAKLGGSHSLFGLPYMVVGPTISGIFGLIFWIFLSTNAKSLAFVDEVFSEIKKTTWPNAKTTGTSTIVVSIMIGIAAFILFVVDYIWGVFFRAIL